MNRYPDDVLRSFARWRNYIWGDVVDTCWHLNYKDTMLWLGNTALNATAVTSGRRQYYYQQCAQLGYMKITSDAGLFPDVIPAAYHFNICRDLFGLE